MFPYGSMKQLRLGVLHMPIIIMATKIAPITASTFTTRDWRRGALGVESVCCAMVAATEAANKGAAARAAGGFATDCFTAWMRRSVSA